MWQLLAGIAIGMSIKRSLDRLATYGHYKRIAKLNGDK